LLPGMREIVHDRQEQAVHQPAPPRLGPCRAHRVRRVAGPHWAGGPSILSFLKYAHSPIVTMPHLRRRQEHGPARGVCWPDARLQVLSGLLTIRLDRRSSRPRPVIAWDSDRPRAHRRLRRGNRWQSYSPIVSSYDPHCNDDKESRPCQPHSLSSARSRPHE
jgi:hypothetical protein